MSATSSSPFGQREKSLGGSRASKNDKREEVFRPTDQQEEFMKDTSNQILMSGTVGAGKCVAEGTPVRMADGTHKPIEAVEPGDEVLSFNEETYGFEVCKVTAAIDSGMKPGVVVTLNGSRELTVSTDHPLFVADDIKQKYTGPYVDGERVCAPTTHEWRMAGNVERMDLVATPRVQTGGDDDYPISVFELAGFLVGDGGLTSGVQFSAAEPSVVAWVRERLPDAVQVVEYDTGHYGISTGRRGGNVKPVNPVKAVLEEWGLMGCSTHEKRIPDSVFTASVEAKAAFLSGLVVADGWVDSRGVGFMSINPDLAEDVRRLYRLLGVSGVFNKGTVEYNGETRARYRLNVQRVEDLYRLDALCDFGHKHSKLDTLLDEKDGHCRGQNRHYYRGDVEFKRVKSVEAAGEVQTYDLEVEGTHTFIANGVVVHNSKIGCEKGYMLNTKYPGNRGLIVRKAFMDVRSSTINQTLLHDVIPDSHIVEHNKDEHRITHLTGAHYPDGEPITSDIYYHGIESGRKTAAGDIPRKIGSHEYGWIFVDEGTELDIAEWNGLITRLRFNGHIHDGIYYPVPPEAQQIFTATNPAGPAHWMYRRFMPDSKDAWDDVAVYRMSVEDNPGATEDYIDRLRSTLSGIYYERLFEGKWVGAEGMVFDEYLPTEHLIHPEDLPKGWNIKQEKSWAKTGETSYWAEPPDNWDVYRAVDFGHTHPFVCFDDQTEILTEGGWVNFPDLERGVDVATVNPQTREMEFQTPLSYIDQWYEGEMVRGSSKEAGADFMVTPNHQMVLENRKTGEWSKRRADDLPNWDHSIPVGGWTSSEGEPDTEFAVPHVDDGDRSKTLPPTSRGAFARFLGLWLADGDAKRGHIRIAQKDGLDAVRSVLKRLGWKWSESSNGEGTVQFDISSIDLWRFFRDHDLLHGSRGKRIPDFAWEWEGDTLRRLLEGLMLGDGSQDDDNDPRGSYYTMSRRLADDAQRLAARLGIPSRILDHDPGDFGDGTGRLYQVSFHVHERATLSKMDIREVDYDGMVHCVEVPNGTLVVRRNDRPMVCGNCQWWARSPDDVLILFREIYRTERIVEDHAEDIHRLTDDSWRVLKTIADHDAEGRETLERHGVSTVPAEKSVLDGIQAVKSRLKLDDQGQAELYFMEGARTHKPDPKRRQEKKTLKTVDEISSYTWDEDAPRDEERPLKENDHGMDSMRYLVYTIDGGVDISSGELEEYKKLAGSW